VVHAVEDHADAKKSRGCVAGASAEWAEQAAWARLRGARGPSAAAGHRRRERERAQPSWRQVKPREGRVMAETVEPPQKRRERVGGRSCERKERWDGVQRDVRAGAAADGRERAANVGGAARADADGGERAKAERARPERARVQGGRARVRAQADVADRTPRGSEG
jgi:hypothetical protein